MLNRALVVAAFSLLAVPAAAQDGAILHYIRSNGDGSLPEHVVQYRPTPERIEVYKWVDKCEGAAYVTAEVDPARREATTLYAGKVARDGGQDKFGTLSLNPATRTLALDLGAGVVASAANVGSPWYLFDYDFADLNAALQQAPPVADFAFDLMLAWPEGEALTLKRVGRVEARDRGVEGSLRRFDLHLDGGAAPAGKLALDPASGRIVEATFDRPNHAEYRDFALKLEKVEHGEAAWRALLAGHYGDCAAANLAQTGSWRNVDADTGRIAEVADLRQLAADFPDSATVRLRLVNALMNAGAAQEAAMEAYALSQRGYAFSEGAEAILTKPLELDYAAWFGERTRINRAPISRSALLATIPAEAQLVESVARDPKSGALYATTAVSRALYVKRGDAAWQKLDVAGAGSLSGIAYDARAKLLWIASGNLDETPGDKVAPALLGFDPATGQVARRLDAGGTGALGDVAVGEDGTVYAADPLSGVVYTARRDETALRPLVGPGVLRSPQGMVAVGKQLIVTDYAYGLAVIDTETGKVDRVASAVPAMLDGIDGLWRHGKSLIAVQNGASPMRIVRLDMSDDWRTVRQVRVLEQTNPAWSEPVGGAVVGNELLYVATGQWGTFGPGGAVREGKTPAPTEVRTLPLGE